MDSFDLFPHGSLLLLLNITLSSQLVLFEHRTVVEYQRLFDELTNGEVEQKTNLGHDAQTAFTQLFIRNKTYSIRENICRAEALQKGLLTINTSCAARCWDFTNTFSQRTEDKNARTFNGIHSPRDRSEVLFDLLVLSRIR